MELRSFAESLFDAQLALRKALQCADQSKEVKSSAAFLHLFQDDFFYSFQKRIEEAKAYAFVECHDFKKIQHLSDKERGLYWITKPDVPPERRCSHCCKEFAVDQDVDQAEKQIECGKCHQVRYCSVNCQTRNAPWHQLRCQ